MFVIGWRAMGNGQWAMGSSGQRIIKHVKPLFTIIGNLQHLQQ